MWDPLALRRGKKLIALVPLVLGLLVLGGAQATPGDLDPSFGTGGRVLTLPTPQGGQANALVVQPDGKLVAAGGGDTGGFSQFALVRYRLDGSLDPTFSGGKVLTPIGAGSAVESVALQPDGKIVAAGSSYTGNTALALARYRSNGTLDPTFGTGGKVTTAVPGGQGVIRGIALQADGKIVVSAQVFSVPYVFRVMRYRSNGSLDPGFGAGGTATVSFGDESDFPMAVAVQPDGKIVVVGSAYDGSANRIAVARLRGNGSLDPTFGTGGKVTTVVGDSSTGLAVVIQPDAKIVVVGTTHSGSATDFLVERYMPNGTPDDNFGGGGTVTTHFENAATANSVALQANGKIVVAGYGDTPCSSHSPSRLCPRPPPKCAPQHRFCGGPTSFALARYMPNGPLDSSFGSGGTLMTSFDDFQSRAAGVGIQPDGKIVAAGTDGGEGPSHFALARYLSGYTLTVGKYGTGTGTVRSTPAGIDCGATCAASFGDGAQVTLTAIPDPGSAFLVFEGSACTTLADTCTADMSTDKSVTAIFTPAGSVSGSASVVLSGGARAKVAVSPSSVTWVDPSPGGITLSGAPVTSTAAIGQVAVLRGGGARPFVLAIAGNFVQLQSGNYSRVGVINGGGFTIH
jgi:uncharacterized delta-60 repeat protein